MKFCLFYRDVRYIFFYKKTEIYKRSLTIFGPEKPPNVLSLFLISLLFGSKPVTMVNA